MFIVTNIILSYNINIMFDKIKQYFVEIFDKNKNGHLHFSELYPLFLIFALLTLFLIISKNLDILIIFKKRLSSTISFDFIPGCYFTNNYSAIYNLLDRT